ncbi:PTS sorbose transporter subunit IIC, partial [Lactobacillus johnsonii]
IALAMPLIIVGSLFMVSNGFPCNAWTIFLTKTAVHGFSLSQILFKVSY